MALGRGNIQIDVGARGLTEDIVKQVRTAEKKIRPLSVSLDEKGFRQPLGRITGDLAEFQKSLDASVARTLAFGAAVGVLNTVTQGFKAMIQSAAEVEKKLTDINVILNLNANSLEDFSSKLFQAAKNTGQSFETVSDAAVELSRQGLGAEETLKRINDAMILTRLSGMDAAKSVETLTAAVNSFGDTALTTTELVNKLATVDAAFAVSTEDLANALARAGSTAQSAKVDLNELLAAVTSVQQTTARGGSVIGNAFKSIFTRIQRSGVREALEEIGVATTDSFGNIRGALNILKDYAGVYSTLSDSQRAYTDELIAGVFQINNLKALVKDLGSDYSIYERALNQSNNATDEAVRRNEKLQGTLSALINEASVNAKELAATLGDLVATPAVENLLKIFNSISGALADALDPEKGNKLIQNMFKSIGNFIAGPGLILIGVAFVKLFKFITGQSVKAVQEIFKIGSATNKIAEAEAKIGFLLKNNKTLYEAISNEALSHEQKEELVLQTIKAQNKAYAQQQAMISRLAGSRAVGGALRNRAGGYIPNFTKKVEGAINSERSAIAAGEGGASRSAKPKVLNNFPIGGGRRETIVANTDEVIVPKFGGSSGSAIFNQDMIRSAGGVPKGAIPVARGFIPNFASSLQKNKEFSKFLNSKDGLSIDVERDLGGFGLVSAAGARGRQSATLKRMSGFSPSKNNQIIDKISGSKLTQEDKKYISGVIERKRTRFENIGTSSIMEMESATARNTIQGKAGAINELIQPFMADAVANVSSRIYNSILGNEVGSSLVGNVRRQANVDSTIVSPSVEGGIFESALRLGSAESAKSLGKDSSSAIWDFEETGNITNDMRDIFFSGYNIQKGDAKRVGGSTSINETVEKSHKDFFDKSLEAIYTQHWSPFFEMGNKLTEGSRKKPRAKKGLAKAGGFIPNYVADVRRALKNSGQFQPQDILTIGRKSSKEKDNFVKNVSAGDLLNHLRSNLRDNKYVNIIKDNFIKDKTKIGQNYKYRGINEQSLGDGKEKTFDIKGKTPAYIYSRKKNIRSWSSEIQDLGDETARSTIHPKLKQYIKNPYYNFDSVSIKKPETSATNINYNELRNRIEKSLGKKKLNLNEIFKTGEDIFPKSSSKVDDGWRERYNKIIKSKENKEFFKKQLKRYQQAERGKNNVEKGFAAGRIFEELINNGLAAAKQEMGYLSTLDNANWDLGLITKKERDVLNLKSAGFGDIKTTLAEGVNKESFIKKFIRQPFGGNASGGFIPNFANSLEEAVVREKQALSDQGSGAQVYVDQDNRVKGSRNPMGLLVANTRDEPLSGSQGVDRALATGMNPKNHGMGMSGGYVPNYVAGAVIRGASGAGKVLTTIKDNAFKTFLGLELIVTPILQSLGAEFDGFASALGDGISYLIKGTGSLLGMNVANQELIESNEKYQESVEKQINIISQNIEKVDKFAQTLAILGIASEKGDVGAIGKTVQNLLEQAGDLQNIDLDAFKDLLSSIGDSEKLKESTQNLKDLIEQGKNLKTFGSDFAELVNKLEGKDSFKDAEISGQDIKNITSQLTANLSPEKFKQLNDELKGFNVDSGNSINKIISLQSVLGDFDATLISNISQSKDLTQEVLRSLKAQAAYKEASKQLTAALTKNLLPITNLNKQFDQLANAITASANAIDKSYKTLSEISEIQSGSRLEQLKGAGTVTSTDLLRGQAAADIAKVTKDGQQKIQSLLRSFTQTTLKESEKGSVLEGTLQKIVDSLANGGSTEDAIKLLLEVQKDGNAKQKEAAQKTIEAIRGASQDQVAASKVIQARLEAQLQSERIQAVNFQRNNQLSESQLKLFSDFSNLSKAQATEARSTLQEISDLNKVISTVKSLGGNKDILAGLTESNRKLSQLENFRQAFSNLGSAAGVTFDAKSLGELDDQVQGFIESDVFGKLDETARKLVIALTDGIEKARELEKQGGVKTKKDVQQAAETRITEASIGSLANQFKQVLSEPLKEALKIGPDVADVLSKPIGDISEIAKNIQAISSENAANAQKNTEIQKQNADEIAKAVAAMQVLSGPEGISGAATKMETAAGIMEKAAKKIFAGGAASGFVPSFSPMGEQVARAVKTERALGGKPVVDYNKQVGTYVRDGNTQPNFAAVKRDHPEGLKKATQNSRVAQGALNAKGFVPNYITPKSGETYEQFKQRLEQAKLLSEAQIGEAWEFLNFGGVLPVVDLFKSFGQEDVSTLAPKELRNYMLGKTPTGLKVTGFSKNKELFNNFHLGNNLSSGVGIYSKFPSLITEAAGLDEKMAQARSQSFKESRVKAQNLLMASGGDFKDWLRNRKGSDVGAYSSLIGGTGSIGAAADIALTLLTGGALGALGKTAPALVKFAKTKPVMETAKNIFSKKGALAALEFSSLDEILQGGGLINQIGSGELHPMFRQIIMDPKNWRHDSFFGNVLNKSNAVEKGPLASNLNWENWLKQAKTPSGISYDIEELINDDVNSLFSRGNIPLKLFKNSTKGRDSLLQLSNGDFDIINSLNAGKQMKKIVDTFPQGNYDEASIARHYPEFIAQKEFSKVLYNFHQNIISGGAYQFPTGLNFTSDGEGAAVLSNIPMSYSEKDIEDLKALINIQEQSLRGELEIATEDRKNKVIKPSLDSISSWKERANSFSGVFEMMKALPSFSQKSKDFVNGHFVVNGMDGNELNIERQIGASKAFYLANPYPEGSVKLDNPSINATIANIIETIRSESSKKKEKVNDFANHYFPSAKKLSAASFALSPTKAAETKENIQNALNLLAKKDARLGVGGNQQIEKEKEAIEEIQQKIEEGEKEGVGIWDGMFDPSVIEKQLFRESALAKTGEGKLRDLRYSAILGKIDQSVLKGEESKALSFLIKQAQQEFNKAPDLINKKIDFEKSSLLGDPIGAPAERQKRVSLYTQLEKARKRGQDTRGLEKRIAGHEEAIGFLESEKAKYENKDEKAIADFVLTQRNPSNTVRVGPNKRILNGFYRAPENALKTFQEIKKKYKIDVPNLAIDQIKEASGIKDPTEYLFGVGGWGKMSENERNLDTLYAKIRKAQDPLNGEIFKKEFKAGDQAFRTKTMMMLGIRSGEQADGLPGKKINPDDFGMSLQSLKKTLGKSSINAPLLFLIDELSNNQGQFSEIKQHILSEQIKSLKLPFVDGMEAESALSSKKVRIFKELGLDGTQEEVSVPALESADVSNVISFITSQQLKENINQIKKRAEGQGQFNEIESAILGIAGEDPKVKLMQSPLYLKYLKDQFGFDLQEKVNKMLAGDELNNKEQWGQIYDDEAPKALWRQVFGNTDYGEMLLSPVVDNNPRVLNADGLNPFFEFTKQDGVDTEEKAIRHVLGESLNHGINSKFEGLLNNHGNPFASLGIKSWQSRSQAASEEILKLARNYESRYLPFGYSKDFRKDSPIINTRGDQSVDSLYKMILEYGKKEAEAPANAKGFVPNFSAIAGEIAASRMAGYKSPVSSSQVKTMNIPGVGKTAYNTQESVFKMPGMSQPFIAPPSNSKAATGYRKAVEKKFNFNPYGKTAADGFVPNFANGGSELKSVVSGLENFVRSFGDNVANLGQALSSLNFEQLTSASQQMIDSASEFSRQSSTIKEAADIFKQGANGISQAKTKTTNSGNIDQSASLIQQSVDGLSKELQKDIKVDSSTITEPINSLTNALSTVRGEIDIKVPNINVSVNGASAVSSSIKAILEQQIPKIVEQTIAQEKQKLIQEIRENIF